MKIPLYQIDVFTSKIFSGNPAPVCPLQKWLDEKVMQAIAVENNLSETAFFVRQNDHYALRWFTPTVEVDLYGHATQAAAFVIFNYPEPMASAVQFHTRSGVLTVLRGGDLLIMDFPARRADPCSAPELLIQALGIVLQQLLHSRDYLAVFDSEAVIKSLAPDMNLLSQIDGLRVIVTATGKHVDFISRFFAPKVGVPEDPVTGSSNCTLIPYWSERLGKRKFHALQVSARGGGLFCEDLGDRVKIAGRAVLFFEGYMFF